MPHEEQELLIQPETISFNRGRLYVPLLFVLLLVFLERVAFYSLTSNLFLFLTQEKWSPYNSMVALFLFAGIAYISCFFGGLLADTLLGRYSTICFGFVLLTTIYWLLPFLSPESQKISCVIPISTLNSTLSMYEEPCGSSFLAILIIAGIGCGIVKANIVPFGAEQSRSIGPHHLRVYSSYFYWSVNLGAFVAILAIGYVQQTYGFYYGYMAPAASISVALFVLLCSYRLYSFQSPTRGMFSTIFDVIREAYRSNKRFKMRLSQSRETSPNQENLPSWLDMAKVSYGGKFREAVVDDVKSLRTIIIVFIFLVPYWVLYFQMQTSFLDQGLHMRLGFSKENSSCSKKDVFYIPAAWLTLFDVITLLLFIPFMDRIVYPFLDRRGMKIPLLSRIIIGMLLASLSMLVAGLVEHFRYNFAAEETVCQVIENTKYYVADMSILWQIPQYMLIGFSEIFAIIGGVEFACSQAPNSMQGAIMGLFYFFTGIGSLLGSLVLYAFEYIDYNLHWNIVEINSGKLSYYFFTLSVFQFVTLIIFFLVSLRLKIRVNNVTTDPVMQRVFLNGNHSSYDSIERS